MEGLGIRIVVERLGIEVVIEGLGIRAGCFFFNSAHYLELPVRARRIPHTKGDIRLPLEAGLINYDLGESHSTSALRIFLVYVLVCCRAKRWTPHVGFEKQPCPGEM